MGFLREIDYFLFSFLNSIVSSEPLDHFFKYITKSDHIYLPLGIVFIVFIFFRKKEAITVIGLALLTFAFTDMLGYRVLKPLFDRPRPCNPLFFTEETHLVFNNVNFLLGMKGSGSFPSNHALNTFAQAGLFYTFYPEKWIWFFSAAGLISFSRIYCGVHYPSDVIAGGALGICIGVIVYYLYNTGKRFFSSFPVNRKEK